MPGVPIWYSFAFARAGSTFAMVTSPNSPNSSWTMTLPDTPGAYYFAVDAINGTAPYTLDQLLAQEWRNYSVTQ